MPTRKAKARKPRPDTITLTEGDFSAGFDGKHWWIKWPWGELHRVNVRAHEAQVRVLLQFIRVAYSNGAEHTLRRIHEALRI